MILLNIPKRTDVRLAPLVTKIPVTGRRSRVVTFKRYFLSSKLYDAIVLLISIKSASKYRVLARSVLVGLSVYNLYGHAKFIVLIGRSQLSIRFDFVVLFYFLELR